MTGPEADRIYAAWLEFRGFSHAMRGVEVPDDAKGHLLKMQDHMGPLIDQARAMRAPADEIDPDEAREAVRETRYAY